MQFGHTAALPGGENVAGSGAAGIPVHAVQSHTARQVGGDGGQHGGLPAKVSVAIGGGDFLAQLCSQRPERQQAQNAYHDEHQSLRPERIREQAGEQGGSCADGEIMFSQTGPTSPHSWNVSHVSFRSSTWLYRLKRNTINL